MRREYFQEWYRKNPGYAASKRAEGKAWRYGKMPPWADNKTILAVYQEAANQGLTVDHIVPLSAKYVCGLHCEANLQIMSVNDNNKKNNHYWPDMW